MNWFCCTREYSRKIYPEYSYNWYTTGDHQTNPNSNSKVSSSQREKHKQKYNEILHKCQDTKNPYDHEQYARIKIKSKDVGQIMSNVREGNKYFIDEDFPHIYSNVSNDQQDTGDIEWKRVGELVAKAVYSLPAHQQEYLPGYKSNNKALQVCLTLISRTHPQKLQRIRNHRLIPQGLYEFKLFKDGIIHNIIIDDFVPSYKGHHIFTGPANQVEVYPMLLEKAIAKISGGYGSIPANALAIMEMIYCGAIRRDNLDDLRNLGQFGDLVVKTLGRNGLTILVAKQDSKIRHYGINNAEIYQIINQYPVVLGNGEEHTLYEILSENRMSAWNGSFRITDPQWKEVSQSTRTAIMKSMQERHSFIIMDKEIHRVFGGLVVYEDTETMNKDWLQSYSESGYPSFCRFRLKQKDTVFLRVTAKSKIRQSFILGRVAGEHGYELMGGAFDDSTEFLEGHYELEGGEYVICVLQEWVLKKEGEYIVYLSSTCRTVLISEIKPLPNFLQLLLTDHEHRSNTSRVGIFYRVIGQVGLGYLKVYVGQPAQIKKIQVNIKYSICHIGSKIRNEDWQIVEPFNDMKQIVTTSDLMVILRMTKTRPKELSTFPIQAFIVNGSQ